MYDDFTLEITAGQAGDYSVLVKSPRGEGRAVFVPPYRTCQSDGLKGVLGKAGDPRALIARDETGAPLPSPEGIGERLFTALFPGEILRLYERSVDRLEGRAGRGLRLKLMLDPRDPSLAPLHSLPWELLRQPGTPDFLALSRLRPIVRYLTIPRPIRAARQPARLRVLAVAANPPDEHLYRLDLERERRNLGRALADLRDVEIVDAESPTLEGLRQTLLSQECHVLHFMGHGSFAAEDWEGVLYLETPEGRADPVRGTDLINKLADFPLLRLVVLNACESARAAGEDGGGEHNPFSGVAVSLVMGGLPAVVAMQFPISDEAAIAFSQAFYQRLATGDPVDAAVAEGRQAIHSRDPGRLEWATPVLFMRTPDGALFPEKDVLPQGMARRRLAYRIAAGLFVVLCIAGLWRWGVEKLTERGKSLFEDKRFTEAQELFKAASILAPISAEAHSNLAAVAERLGDPEAVERHYREALRLQPEDASHLYRLGSFLNTRGRFEEAYFFLQGAVEKDPGHAEAYGELALAALGQKHLDESREALRKGLQIEPERAPLHRLLGEVALHQDEPREAIAHLQAALDRYPLGEPGRVQTFSLLVEAYDRLGDAVATCREVDHYNFLDPPGISPWAPAVGRIAMRRSCSSRP